MSRTLRFDEPHRTGGNAQVTLTEEQAIAHQHTLRYYANDADALDDFMIVNWAWFVPEEEQDDGVPQARP